MTPEFDLLEDRCAASTFDLGPALIPRTWAVPDWLAGAIDALPEASRLGYSAEALAKILTFPLLVPPDFVGPPPQTAAGGWQSAIAGTKLTSSIPPNSVQGTFVTFDKDFAIWHLPNQDPFAYGGQGWFPVLGDWDGDGMVTVGVVDPNSVWYLKNTNAPGAPDVTPFAFGAPGWRPVTGDWNHDGTDKVGVVDFNGTAHLAVPGGVREIPAALLGK